MKKKLLILLTPPFIGVYLFSGGLFLIGNEMMIGIPLVQLGIVFIIVGIMLDRNV